ncbi:UbiA family prenyltransferase [Bdellovibrio sp. ZAP7]|uniref:UbiA family prenyltransferase n=1 Tax=Bdellovibrio sp. ZAP7 TaxID=2231053 RepID=UPI001FF06E62|nr:UbiA family prenyltransferase [Bdellovibrio sp. ZAP7]
MRNWLILIKERFSPFQYIPMIVAFTVANGLYLAKIESHDWSWSRFAMAFVLMLSFFFRMRLFDEIKDYEVDLKINPTRPLARGILSVTQVKHALMILILLELVVVSQLGLPSFLVHVLGIGYSLLMYEEFFIGDILRPHLTTYAVSHTFVSVLLGISAAVGISGATDLSILCKHAAFFLVNWCFFNLFEFARKTFAPEEEKENVPSYSNIFGTKGAYLLSISQVVLGLALLRYQFGEFLMWPCLLAAVYLVATIAYLFKPKAVNAKLFRGVTGAYLLGHFIVMSIVLGA